MALVVLLKGINVGGHRTFRPATLAEGLKHLDVVNIGATGTFVVRRRVGRASLRAELARRLPFEAEVVICEGREILSLIATDPFADEPTPPDAVRFVSLLSRRPRSAPPVPMTLPATGDWLVKILAREERFILGVYRRHMKVIGLLASLDRLFGAPVTTRNWNTMNAIAKALQAS